SCIKLNQTGSGFEFFESIFSSMYASYTNNWEGFIAFFRQKTDHFCRTFREWFSAKTSSFFLVFRFQIVSRNGRVCSYYSSNLCFFDNINNIQKLLISQIGSNFQKNWFLFGFDEIFILESL